jgi:hypothetical protein
MLAINLHNFTRAFIPFHIAPYSTGRNYFPSELFPPFSIKRFEVTNPRNSFNLFKLLCLALCLDAPLPPSHELSKRHTQGVKNKGQ